MDFYERLRLLAREKGVSFNQVESSIGLSRNSLYLYKTKNPTSKWIVALATYFEVTTDYLLGIEKQTFLSLKNFLDLLPARQYSVDVKVYFSESLSEDNQNILPRSQPIFESCRWGDKEEYFLDLSNLKDDIINKTKEWHGCEVTFIDSGCHNYEENCLIIAINPN